MLFTRRRLFRCDHRPKGDGLSACSLRPHRGRSRIYADRRRWRNDRHNCDDGTAFDGGHWRVSFRRERRVIARAKPLFEIAVFQWLSETPAVPTPQHFSEMAIRQPEVLWEGMLTG